MGFVVVVFGWLVGWFSILIVCCFCLFVVVVACGWGWGWGGGDDILQIYKSVCAPFSFDCDDVKGGFASCQSPLPPLWRVRLQLNTHTCTLHVWLGMQ